ncbi:ImmA/IrrE family metallo-endopeptidase [Aliterella atlantica]|uniref:Zn peptidase n=1 Tax=Aliterella atlantica CENA595 TaxID=1618023 RepID=A0A0D8ZTC5_9CYAN|nr:ImmA/IrrE family metallo-endopeptidase [Aliterella atlantica]KJH71995.1 Zn peptidase [Aliterella atlantica CENA595]
MSLFKPYRFIQDTEIEAKANNLLKRMKETPKYAPKWPFDATRVADFLDIGVCWESIPADKQGQIAALIFPVERQIVLNEDIPQLKGGFGESTLAHEIGHWELHIDRNVAGIFEERIKQGLEVNMQPFLCRSVSGQLQKIEWQAQRFASYLLMPQYILEQMQVGRDLTNWKHLYAIADELGVTISNLKNHLQQLGWIIIPGKSRQIYLGNAAPGKRITRLNDKFRT